MDCTISADQMIGINGKKNSIAHTAEPLNSSLSLHSNSNSLKSNHLNSRSLCQLRLMDQQPRGVSPDQQQPSPQHSTMLPQSTKVYSNSSNIRKIDQSRQLQNKAILLADSPLDLNSNSSPSNGSLPVATHYLPGNASSPHSPNIGMPGSPNLAPSPGLTLHHGGLCFWLCNVHHC